MTIEYRTIADYRQMILDAFTVYQPEASTADGSDAWVMAQSLAIQFHRHQLRQSEIATYITPLFAEGTKLDEHGERWLPSASRRRGATKWRGVVRLTATAAVGLVAPGVTLVSGSGVAYITTAAGSLPAPGSTDDIAAEAVVAGTAANLADLTPLTLTSPPVGVSPDAIIVSTSAAATDRETDADYRIRVLNATRLRPASGNAAHVLEWASSVEGVGAAFVYPRWHGLCTFAVVPIGPPGARWSGVTGAMLTAIEDAIEEERPAGHTAYVYAPTQVPTDVEVQVTPMEGYDPDWTGALTTAAGCTATDINTTTDPTLNGVTSGMRVVIEVGASPVGEQRIVDVVGPGNKFTVTEAFSAVPGAALTVYPGGPLWEPIREAVEDLFDTLGPSRSASPSTTERVPSPRSQFHSYLFRSDLIRAVDAVSGVMGVALVAPAVDIDPTSAVGGILIYLLTLRNVRVVWL